MLPYGELESQAALMQIEDWVAECLRVRVYVRSCAVAARQPTVG